MTYSCTDFADDVIDALGIDLSEHEQDPDEAGSDYVDIHDSPSNQADLALEEIQRLQRIEKETRHALAVLADTGDKDRFVARVQMILKGEEESGE